MLGEPIFVPRDCEGEEFERLRALLEMEMDRVHARAYALVGRRDRAALYAPAGASSEAAA